MHSSLTFFLQFGIFQISSQLFFIKTAINSLQLQFLADLELWACHTLAFPMYIKALKGKRIAKIFESVLASKN
jgi:hypothetical protein